MPSLADRPPQRRFKGLLYGPPGSGKTVFAHQLPRTRTLDFDDGMDAVRWAIRAGIIDKNPEDIIYETILETDRGKYGYVRAATALDRATDQVDEWMERAEDWETLIIDSGSALSDYTINKGQAEMGRLKFSKSKQQSDNAKMRIMKMQDWGAGSSLFQQFTDWARSLDKNLVLICHEYQATNDEGAIMRVEPLLIGQLRQRIAKDFSEVWYMTQEGSRQKPKYKVQTVGTRKVVAKSRIGCLEGTEETDFAAIRAKVAEFYGVAPDSLWTGG